MTNNLIYVNLIVIKIKKGVVNIFLFQFRGGVKKPTEHINEKFLLFFLIGEQEVPFYQMTKEGLANRVEHGRDEFVTAHQICKLFISRQGFGIAKLYHSFYIRLDPSCPTVQIRPFPSLNDDGDMPKPTAENFYFRAKAKLMERKEVLNALPEKLESRIFFSRQEVLSLNLMDRMVSVDRSEMKQNIRYVKLGKRN